MFTAIQDPRDPTVPPPRAAVAPHFNFAPLENGADALTASAERYAKALAGATQRLDTLRGDGAAAPVNTLLLESERRLTDPEGLPGRPWYIHQLYAPGMYTGYGVKTVPAVREAIEQKQFDRVDAAIARVGAVLRAEAVLVDSAVVLLQRAGR